MYGHCGSVEMVCAGRLEMRRSSEAGRESNDKLRMDAEFQVDFQDTIDLTLSQLAQGYWMVLFAFATGSCESSFAVLLWL